MGPPFPVPSWSVTGGAVDEVRSDWNALGRRCCRRRPRACPLDGGRRDCINLLTQRLDSRDSGCQGSRAKGHGQKGRASITHRPRVCRSQWFSRRQNTTFPASILHSRPFVDASPIASLSTQTSPFSTPVCFVHRENTKETMSSLFERIKSAIPSGGLQITSYKVLRQGQVSFYLLLVSSLSISNTFDFFFCFFCYFVGGCQQFSSGWCRLSKDYEERLYPPQTWVRTQMRNTSREACTYPMFWKLFNYISGQNERQVQIPMTAPVSVLVEPDGETEAADGVLQTTFTMAFYIPAPFDEDPPRPNDSDVSIEYRPEIRLFSRLVFFSRAGLL